MVEIIEFDEECRSCKGTGLYHGMGEGPGAAVVCYKCNGTGRFHFKHEYEVFTGRKKRFDIDWVIEHNPGFGVGQGGGYRFPDFGGMSYEEWLSGKPFAPGMEMRRFVCPAWWYQAADYSKMPQWPGCSVCGRSFRTCPRFTNKSECWSKWDQEFGTK